METILHLKNVTKSIKKNIILKNVTFSISKGEIVGLLGANGAGKSTCMKLIGGLYKPTATKCPTLFKLAPHSSSGGYSFRANHPL